MSDCMPLLAVCDFTMGQSPSSDTYNTNGDGMPFYQGNADFGKRSPSPRVWCNSPKKTANEGDILISVRAPIGAINIAAEQCCIGRGLAALAVRPDAATRDYLEHYLRYKRPELERRGTGSTFKAVGKKVFAEMTLPIVSVDEQSEIAKKLNNALELQEEAASQISMLDELVKSRFVEMFGDPVHGEANYTVLRWNDVFETKTGKLDSNQAVEDGQYPFFTCSKEPLRIDKYAFDCEALLLAGNNAAAKYDVKHYKGKFNAYQRTYVLRLLDPEWRYELFKLQLENQLELMRSRSLGTNTRYLTLKILGELEFIVPPLALQQEFAAFVQQVDKLKFETQQAIEKLQLLYDSLAQEYFGS